MRKAGLVLLVIGMLVALPLVALTQDDGRINDAAHLGGIGIFCATEAGAATNDLGNAVSFDLWGPDGDLLVSIPFSEVPLIGSEGIPTYSAANGASMGLASLADGSILAFGTDEHGKEFTFTWLGDCTPVGPPVEPDEDEGIDCSQYIKPTPVSYQPEGFNGFYDIVSVLYNLMPLPSESWITLTPPGIASWQSVPVYDYQSVVPQECWYLFENKSG